MMQKLFYIVYNSYYKHGEYRNDVPLVTVWGILVVSLASLTVFGIFAVHALLKPTARLPSQIKDTWMLIYIFYSVLYCVFFVFNKRYVKIYNRYKDDQFLNSKTGKAIAWAFVIFSFVSPFAFALIWNKIVFGAWT
ncbi:hypothetical protein [Albibacterium profundi]|uniref:Uncharacterized protein n=1 Tax=Albibacterium profundi TaxID=3134906 RepID=A0ABV5CDT4_9SPHI